MTLPQLKALVTLIICSDPWPVTIGPTLDDGQTENQYFIAELANQAAKEHGFDDWIDALHKLK